MEFVLGIVLVGVVLVIFAVKMFMAKQGDAKLIICTDTRTPLVLEEMSETQAVLTSHIDFKNDGTQAPTVTDCFARPLLPFEQYDGIDVRAKVERLDEPREDDYFEAYIIEPHDKTTLNVKITLTARKDMSIREALSRMVDFPIDIVYTAISRRPFAIFKTRVYFTAEEIAKAADVKLVED